MRHELKISNTKAEMLGKGTVNQTNPLWTPIKIVMNTNKTVMNTNKSVMDTIKTVINTNKTVMDMNKTLMDITKQQWA